MAETFRVLYVDDGSGPGDVAATDIEREDERFTVETRTGASEGLEYIATHGTDCVVSEYDMPGRNGIEFLESVREAYPDLPFVLFPGDGSERIASDAISAGVTDYLRKEPGTGQYAVLADRIGTAVEQYRTRQAAAEAERKLSEISEKTDDVLFVFDGDWRELLFVNSAYEDIWGRSVAELRDDPRSFLEHVHPEDRERVTRTMERISNGERDGMEYRVVRPDGERRWVRAETKPVFDDDGAVARVVGFVRDITAARERKRELERLKERYRTLIEHGSDMVTVIDEAGVVQYQSPAIERILGYEQGELLGENAFEYVHPDDREEAWGTFAQTVGHPDTVTGRVEYRFEHADGSWVWVETVGSNRIDTAIEGYVLTTREVTERKTRERRLKALGETGQELMAADSREAVLETGVDSASDVLGLEANGIHLYDEERSGLVPVAQTAAGRELVAEQPTFTAGDSIAWRAYERGEARAFDDVHDDPDVYNPETAIRSELFLPVGDHGVLIAASETAEVFDQQDVVLGEILAGTIATALEQVERTEQLAARERDLRRQNERLDEFASVVSHDLRNPLQVALGRLELAMDDCESPYLADVLNALDRMETLIDDLLTLAREGDQVGELEPVDLGAITETCWQNVEADEATLVVRIDRTIHADYSRLQQLLENLMRNAVEHSETGVTVTVGGLAEGFYVEDDGPGIPKADREAVFDTDYSTSDEGTGFGLSIVQQVVDAHGWTLDVVEGTNGGTRFEVTDVEFDQ